MHTCLEPHHHGENKTNLELETHTHLKSCPSSLVMLSLLWAVVTSRCCCNVGGCCDVGGGGGGGGGGDGSWWWLLSFCTIMMYCKKMLV